MFKLCPIAAAVLGVTLAPHINAQQSTSSGASSERRQSMEEVIVTARKREESLTEIPIAVSAFTAEAMTRNGLDKVTDILRQSPGVQYDSNGSSATGAITIRGLSQPGLVGDETNVPVFIDGIYASGRDAAHLPFSGLQRVEVLRGPQSALFGRSAFAGAVNYVTKKPGSEFESEIVASGGSDGQSGGEFFVSGGLSDRVFARMDLIYSDSGSTHEDPNTGGLLGDRHNEGGRVQLAWDATENLTGNISYTYFESDETPRATTLLERNSGAKMSGSASVVAPQILPGRFLQVGGLVQSDGPVVQPFGPFGPAFREVFMDPAGVPGNRNSFSLAPGVTPEMLFGAAEAGNYRLFSGEVKEGAVQGAAPGTYGDSRVSERGSMAWELALGNYNLSWLTGYSDTTYRAITGYDQIVTAQVSAQQMVGLYSSFGGQPNENRQDFNQEFRVDFANSGPLSWSAGLAYSEVDVDKWLWNAALAVDAADQATLAGITEYFTGAPLYAGLDENGLPPITALTSYTTELASIFFSLGYDISEQMTVTLEGRQSWEDKSADNVANQTGIPTGYNEDSYSYFTPRLTVDYQLTDDAMMYVNIAKGVKAGGINGEAVGDEAIYQPEQNWTYELGSKLTALDGRAQINVAAYYIDWTDQQVRDFSSASTAFGSPSIVVSNLGETEVKGLELDGRLQLTDAWGITAAYVYNKSEIKRGFSAPDYGYLDYESLGLEGVEVGQTTLGVLNPVESPFVAIGTITVDPDLMVSSGNLAGKALPWTPEQTVMLGVDFVTELSEFELFSQLNAVWKDERYLDNLNTAWVNANWDLNFSVGVESESWRFGLKVDNLLDDDTPQSMYRPFILDFKPQPTALLRNGRMWNLDAAYKF